MFPMEKNINAIDYKLWLIALLDLYGGLLTDKYRHSLSLYLNEDWSLAEIAEYFSISRQAVHASITRAANHLEHFEEELGLSRSRQTLRNGLEEIKRLLAENNTTEANKTIEQLLAEI